jgi:hypothetical protein
MWFEGCGARREYYVAIGGGCRGVGNSDVVRSKEVVKCKTQGKVDCYWV